MKKDSNLWLLKFYLKIGIGSGLNNTDIIKVIVDAETAAEKEKIEKDEAEYESKISAFGIVT